MANVRSVIVELIDYDGCLSNHMTMATLSDFLEKHGEEILDLNAQRKARLAKGECMQDIDVAVVELTAKLSNYKNTNDPRVQGGSLEKLSQRANRSDYPWVKAELNTLELACLQVMTYVDAIYELDENIMLQLFIITNPELILHLTSNAEPHQVRYIAPFTNRISDELNKAGRIRNPSGCSFRDFVLLTKYLNDQDPRIVLLPLTQTDIQARLDAGETFRRIYADKDSAHAVALCDQSKLSTLYAISHAVAERHPSAKIRLRALDDRNDLLESLYHLFYQYPVLLREGDELIFHHYNGVFKQHELDSVVGKGSADVRFRENICHLVSLAACGSPRAKVVDLDVAAHVDMREFLAYRAVKAGEKAMAYLFDADGALNNIARKILETQILSRHRVALANIDVIRRDKKKLTDLYHEILIDISEFDLTMTDEVYNKHLAYIEKDIKVKDKDLVEELRKYRGMSDMIAVRQGMRYLDIISPELMTRILLRANRGLFDDLVDDALTAGINIGVIFSYSNRTSELFNQVNNRDNVTRSYYVDLHQLVSLLNIFYSGRFSFVLDRVLLADIYNNLKPGESFARSLIGSADKAHSIYCEYKLNLTLFLCHYIRREYACISVAKIFDDRLDIFAKLKELFHDNQRLHLLPAGLSADLHVYDGSPARLESFVTLTGTGALDHHIEYTLEVMAKMAGVNLSNLKITSLVHDFSVRLNLDHFAKRNEKPPLTKPMVQRARVPSAETLQRHAVFEALVSLPSMRTLSGSLTRESPISLQRFSLLAVHPAPESQKLPESKVKFSH